MIQSYSNLTHCRIDVISSSQIQICKDDGTLESKKDNQYLKCQKMFVVSLTIDSNQDHTELSQFTVNDVKNENGDTFSLVYPVEISFSKSKQYGKSSLIYRKSYSEEKYENVHYTNDYLLFSSCKDSPSDHTCPTVRDASGNQVPYSQGFCCSCDLGSYVGIDRDSRSHLSCTLFGGRSSSASCMAQRPLLYDSYSIEPPVTTYDIVVNITQFNVTTGASQTQTYRLGNDNLILNANGIVIKLVGDFASPQALRTFEDSMLFVNNEQSDPNNPIHKLPFEMRAMIFSKSDVGSPNECNKIATDYVAFQNQPNQCSAPLNSCLDNQIKKFRDQDMALYAKGKKGQYLIKNYGATAEIYKNTGNNNLFLQVELSGKQTSLVTIKIKADNFAFVYKESPGVIVSNRLETFESMSSDGNLYIQTKNIGATNTQYVLNVLNCTEAITVNNPSQVFTMKPNEIVETKFEIRTVTKFGGNQHCYADLKGFAMGTLFDSILIKFNTTDTVIKVPGYNETGSGDTPNPAVPELSCQNYCTLMYLEHCDYSWNDRDKNKKRKSKKNKKKTKVEIYSDSDGHEEDDEYDIFVSSSDIDNIIRSQRLVFFNISLDETKMDLFNFKTGQSKNKISLLGCLMRSDKSAKQLIFMIKPPYQSLFNDKDSKVKQIKPPIKLYPEVVTFKLSKKNIKNDLTYQPLQKHLWLNKRLN
ncbi:hypothetical protein PPL_07716 [Heterostelium album PN500]|uniref:Generative cell specific-1/HAP2 domain-containing protein n=1 Tax=Heterostelium pallidum (strain ATCC 26659 / Pp 5 / PN500) TaxID=670386 RepID=D3BGR4_HETP5|nr:hypothetical protein PPL_07716 [Heterostelium album PN500]EFA79298.1 hypothetical protein PPL_07716 [Heterostelium album PN500]|eukprot:XP_020431419.1 hypothetical protein PPL_07716 [Heterostelium album PN500]